MANIINIETSTEVCSASLSQDGMVLCHHEDYEGRNHATLLSVFLEDIMQYVKSREIKIDAVAVSIGPGSYTGLRIGLSEAKWLACGLDAPLIGVNSLQIIAVSAMFSRFIEEKVLYVPMIDARRMEVYTAAYDTALTEHLEPKAMIIDNSSFADLLEHNILMLCGNGSDKVREVLNDEVKHKNVRYISDIKPNAVDMIALSELAFRKKQFIDLAYSTPLYLKEYEAKKPQKAF